MALQSELSLALACVLLVSMDGSSHSQGLLTYNLVRGLSGPYVSRGPIILSA